MKKAKKKKSQSHQATLFRTDDNPENIPLRKTCTIHTELQEKDQYATGTLLYNIICAVSAKFENFNYGSSIAACLLPIIPVILQMGESPA